MKKTVLFFLYYASAVFFMQQKHPQLLLFFIVGAIIFLAILFMYKQNKAIIIALAGCWPFICRQLDDPLHLLVILAVRMIIVLLLAYKINKLAIDRDGLTIKLTLLMFLFSSRWISGYFGFDSYYYHVSDVYGALMVAIPASVAMETLLERSNWKTRLAGSVVAALCVVALEWTWVPSCLESVVNNLRQAYYFISSSEMVACETDLIWGIFGALLNLLTKLNFIYKEEKK